MTVYIVRWCTGQSPTLIPSSYISNPNKSKMFATKEKAEEFYKKLYEAASLLEVSGPEARIEQGELE